MQSALVTETANGKAARSLHPVNPWLVLIAGLAMFGAIFAVFVKSPVTTSYDSRWTVYSGFSYLHGEHGSLQRYKAEVEQTKFYGVVIVDGQPRNMFPEGPVFLVIPAIAALQLVQPNIEQKLNPGWAGEVETVIASGYCALACVLMFAAVLRYFGSWSMAVGAAAVMAFATPVWSTASRAMWQHGPVILCFALALWLIVESRDRRGMIALAGLPLAFAVICRPSAAIPAVAIAIMIAIVYTRYLAAFVLVTLVVAGAWFIHNLSIFHTLTPAYYESSRLSGAGTFAEALAGNLISPARGLFVFSPVLALALASPFFRRPGSRDGWFIVGCLALSAAHLVLVSLFPHWWGGNSFGPRMMSDATPLLVFAGCFPVAAMIAAGMGGRIAALGLVGLLGGVSAGINAQGALRMGPIEWNATPVPVDVDPSRVWNWRDLQFMRRDP